MTTRNGEIVMEMANAAPADIGMNACDTINIAVERFFRGKRDAEDWIVCPWDGVMRRADQAKDFPIRALLIVS